LICSIVPPNQKTKLKKNSTKKTGKVPSRTTKSISANLNVVAAINPSTHRSQLPKMENHQISSPKIPFGIDCAIPFRQTMTIAGISSNIRLMFPGFEFRAEGVLNVDQAIADAGG
jgi:hypothetical protein